MFVVDASGWVAFFVEGDSNHIEAEQWLAEVIDNQIAVFGPAILLAEVVGAIARRLQSPSEGMRAIEYMLSETRLSH